MSIKSLSGNVLNCIRHDLGIRAHDARSVHLLQFGLLLLDDLVAGAALLNLLEEEPCNVQHLLQVVRLLELDVADLVAVHPLEQVEEHGVLHLQLHLLLGCSVPVPDHRHHAPQLHHLP